MVPMWMFPVALACGNTFILKPSERDPSASLLLAELLQARPACRTASSTSCTATRRRWTRCSTHPDVQAVSFVGSTPIARYIYATGAAHGKRVQALGGAKNHMVVMPDADLDKAVDALMGAAYGSAGERCMAISVAVAVADAIADALIEAAGAADRGAEDRPGNDPGCEMGPLVTREHRDRVRGYVDNGVQEGAKLVVDGRGFRHAGSRDGFFLGGSLFDQVSRTWRSRRRRSSARCSARARRRTIARRST